MRKTFITMLLSIVLLSSLSFGVITLPTDELTTSIGTVTTWFTAILLGLAVIWGFRKLTSTTNKT